MTKQTGVPAHRGINTMRESSLHAAVKQWYARPGDELEVTVDGFTIDLVRNGLLVEVQTSSFGALKRKLAKLTKRRRVLLVHPIAQEKWIAHVDAHGDVLKRRRSPKRGRWEEVFLELVSLPHLIATRNFSLEVLLIQEEEARCNDGKGSWRRKGVSIVNRKLLGVVDRIVLRSPQDFGALLPPALPDSFTTQDLASVAVMPRYLAQKMAYCLRAMGAIQLVGKRGHSLLYTRAAAHSTRPLRRRHHANGSA